LKYFSRILKDESFDLVLEKGVMDALIVDEGSVWDPEYI
jgi:hypothetical protein